MKYPVSSDKIEDNARNYEKYLLEREDLLLDIIKFLLDLSVNLLHLYPSIFTALSALS